MAHKAVRDGVAGNSPSVASSRPTQWLTPTRGLPQSNDNVRAQTAQDCRGAPMPGPLVKQMTSMSLAVSFASSNASKTILLTCCRIRKGKILKELIPNPQTRAYLLVVQCGFSRKESLPWRRDVRLTRVGQYGVLPRFWAVFHNSNAAFVRGAFNPQRDARS
jgi:hypothetical protein